MNIDLPDLLQFAQRLAWQAGKITQRYFQTDLTPEIKADESPVTVADHEAEQFLRDQLTRYVPEHAILGEEGGASGTAGAEWRWIIDPIDGTRSFVRGVPLYGVMIGLEHNAQPVLGVIHLPALNETVSAARGLGCWWNGGRCRVSRVRRMSDALLVATKADQAAYAPYDKQESFARLSEAAGMVRTWGDCYGYVLVATGRAEIMIDPAMSIWDAAPLLPILQEAGGTFTDWNGTPTISGTHGGVGTNGHLHAEVMGLLKG